MGLATRSEARLHGPWIGPDNGLIVHRSFCRHGAGSRGLCHCALEHHSIAKQCRLTLHGDDIPTPAASPGCASSKKTLARDPSHMSPAVAEAANRLLAEGGDALVAMYTDTALLLNACDVAARGYAERVDNFQLSTTQNIPEPYRLPVELDLVVPRSALQAAYQGPVLKRIVEDFVIRMISVIDGTLEDVYEAALRLVHVTMTEPDVAKRVRSAWQQEANGHVRLLNFLVQDAGLVARRPVLDSPDGLRPLLRDARDSSRAGSYGWESFCQTPGAAGGNLPLDYRKIFKTPLSHRPRSLPRGG